MNRAPAPAKLNLALVVGPRVGPAGKHELTTVLQRVDVSDRIEIEPAETLSVSGFPADSLVHDALVALAATAGIRHSWAATIHKQIPIASGLGGGSSDAATALRLANATLDRPLDHETLLGLAASLGADVPFFLEPGPQLGEGDGRALSRLELPQDFWIVILMPNDTRKESTAAVYAAFDERNGAEGYTERRERLLEVLARARRPRDLADLPTNDLASSPLAAELLAHGAFRADVTGAGPAVFGLFVQEAAARAAARALRDRGRTWVTVPCWYG
jgi:4-diphosphocytidyl-2-C-methyl-D-erythritol kinase